MVDNNLSGVVSIGGLILRVGECSQAHKPCRMGLDWATHHWREGGEETWPVCEWSAKANRGGSKRPEAGPARRTLSPKPSIPL